MKTRILIISFLFSLLIFLLPLNTHANTNQQLDLSNASDKYLFNISSMKPGDWATRNLEIQNQIEEEFTYSAKAKFKGGSKKLFKEFQLRVWDANGVELYSGKLHEFKDLSPRFLASGNKEVLTFEAKFPYELGNEFQGLGFEFELRFTKVDTTTNPKQGTEEILNLDSNGNDLERELDQDKVDLGTNSELQERLKASQSTLNQELAAFPVDGQIMPANATNMFKSMFLGAIFLISGSGLYILQRKRNRME